MGAGTSSLDFLTLFIGVHFIHLSPVIGSTCGVILGACTNFVFNRWLAFRSIDPEVARQAMRFALGTALTLALHASAMWLLTGKFAINYLVAKLIADLLIFTGGNLLVNRYLVFSKQKKSEIKAP